MQSPIHICFVHNLAVLLLLLWLTCRCGLSPSSLVEMKRNTLAALADCMELEDLQVGTCDRCAAHLQLFAALGLVISQGHIRHPVPQSAYCCGDRSFMQQPSNVAAIWSLTA
jgi:hypothetical protein